MVFDAFKAAFASGLRKIASSNTHGQRTIVIEEELLTNFEHGTSKSATFMFLFAVMQYTIISIAYCTPKIPVNKFFLIFAYVSIWDDYIPSKFDLEE